MSEGTAHDAAAARRPSEILGTQLREIRDRQGLNQQTLAERLAQSFGVEWDRAAIARIETGKRRVTVDELLLLAAALDVSPLHLLLPQDDDEPVQVSPLTVESAGVVREWWRGFAPLPEQDEYRFALEALGPEDLKEALGRRQLVLRKGKATPLLPIRGEGAPKSADDLLNVIQKRVET